MENEEENDKTSQIQDRIRGAIWGLAAGDKNGGPIRMAIRMAEALLKTKTFNRENIIETYLNWYKGVPYDTEKAFDTGNTFHMVFSKYIKNGNNIDVIAKTVASVTNNAGINAAHRATPISCCGFYSDAELIEISRLESSITHAHIISIETAAAFTVLCRKLILGHPWEEAIKFAMEVPTILEVKNAFVVREYPYLSTSCYAPETFEAALYFTSQPDKDFTSILFESIDFAGSANCCPVLVGALAGAKFGYKVASILEQDLTHIPPQLKERINNVISGLCETWVSQK